MEEKAVVQYVARDGQDIKLTPAIVKKFLVSGNAELVTTQELYLYMGVCKSRGLNPFIKDCYLIKYTSKDNAAIIVSIDYYRKRAKAQPDCEGWETGIIVKQNGNIIYREGTILLDKETLIGGWFKATPKGWKVPMRKEVPVKRYIKKTREGNITRFWSEDNQPEQIAKVAESQGLRAAWPDEFQGLYVDAERQSETAQKELDTSIADAPADVTPDLEEKLGKPQGAGSRNFGATILDPEQEEAKNKAANAILDSIKKPEPETPPGVSEIPTVWERVNWINLKTPGFAGHVKYNLTSFSSLPAKLQAEIISKWHGMYNEPFPQHANQTEQPETEEKPVEKEPEPETEETEEVGPEDAESNERQAVITQMKEYPEDIQFKAKAVLTMATGHGAWPPTLDGCNLLVEKMAELMKE